MNYDILLRAHTVQLERKPRPPKSERDEPKWPDCALIFDCESRITADQTLTFGFWRFCELRNNQYVCTEEGISILSGMNGQQKYCQH